MTFPEVMEELLTKAASSPKQTDNGLVKSETGSGYMVISLEVLDTQELFDVVVRTTV